MLGVPNLLSHDYYDILGVSRSASSADIGKAYRKLALKHHPDKNLTDKDEATERFRKITAAYKVLHDADARRAYDLQGPASDPGISAEEAETIFQEFLREASGCYSNVSTFVFAPTTSQPRPSVVSERSDFGLPRSKSFHSASPYPNDSSRSSCAAPEPTACNARIHCDSPPKTVNTGSPATAAEVSPAEASVDTETSADAGSSGNEFKRRAGRSKTEPDLGRVPKAASPDPVHTTPASGYGASGNVVTELRHQSFATSMVTCLVHSSYSVPSVRGDFGTTTFSAMPPPFKTGSWPSPPTHFNKSSGPTDEEIAARDRANS